MRDRDYEVCGNCKYHEYESIDSGWVCVNPDSDYCADWVEYEHTCEEWTDRNE